MSKNDAKVATQVGIFITFLLMLTSVITILIGKESSIFSRTVTLYVYVNDANLLKNGAPVLLKGISVGRVKDITISEASNVVLTLEINGQYLPFIKKDSFASINTQGMLGDKYIEIDGGKTDSESLKDKDQLNSTDNSGVQAFLHKGKSILDNATEIISKLNNLLGEEEKKAQFNKILDNLGKISTSFQQVTSNLVEITNEVKNAKLIESANKLSKTADNINKITDKIISGPGTAHSLIYDKSLHDDLRSLLGGAQRNKVLKYFIRESINESSKIDN